MRDKRSEIRARTILALTHLMKPRVKIPTIKREGFGNRRFLLGKSSKTTAKMIMLLTLLTLLSFFFLSLVKAPTDKSWIQTSQADFDAGNKTNIDTTTVAGTFRVVLTTEAVDQTQTTTGGRHSTWVYPIAQSFKPSINQFSTKVSIYLWKSGSPPDITVYLKADNNNAPGSTLASKTVSASSITSQAWNDFNWADTTLTANTRYWIYIPLIGTETNHYKWEHSTTDVYANGDAWINGAVYSGWDFTFKIYEQHYESSSNLISQIGDLTATPSSWETFNATETLNGQTIVWEVRSSANNDMSSPTDWTEVENGGVPTITPNRYVQWKAILSTNNTATPVVDDVTINAHFIEPNVTLNSPSDGAYRNNSTVTFNCSAVANGNLVNISLYTNTTGIWHLNTTNNVTGMSNSTKFTVSGIADAGYVWNCLAYNDANLSDFASANYTFYVDTIAPAISVTYPANNSYLNQDWINITGTASDTNNDTVYINDTRFGSNRGTYQSWNFTNTSIADGTYSVLITANDSANNTNSTNVVFTIDRTAPSITNISINPSAPAYVDPNVNLTVTVNVTDAGTGVDTVLLRYANYSDYNNSVWRNKSMDNITGDLYNASFTPDVNGTWYYQVWANDTVGNAINNTPNSTDVQYDCTWQMSYDIQNASGVLDTSSLIGNITLNNTGDVEYYNNNCTIRFEIDAIEMPREGLKFKGIGEKEEVVIYPYLYAEGVLGDASGIINVTAYFAGEEIENENFIISIIDKYRRSDTYQRNITGYIDSTPGGPYLKPHIDALATINQSSSADLTAYVKNVGNETATSVWFNWTLPSGFSNSSGALENNLTSLPNKTGAPENIQYYNLTISTDYTATYGTNYIYANASCAENASGCSNRSYSISVKVLCNPDSECGSGCTYDSTGLADNHDPGCYVAPTTITTGGGGVGAPPAAIVSEAIYELIRGKDENFSLEVKNPFKEAWLKDIKMKVAGFLSQYISVEPATLDEIPPNSSFNFTIRIVAPAYFVVGEHNLTFTIDSVKELGVMKTARVEKRYISLVIHELGREDAAQLITLSKDYIEKMRALELNTKGVRSLLEQSQEALEKRDYEKVQELCAEIEGIATAALESHDIIIEIEKKIKDAERSGVKVEGARRMLGLAKAASDRGDYALALERAKDAEVTFALETKGEFNLLYFIAQNTLEVFFGTLIILALLTTLFFRVKLSVINRSLTGLHEEEGILLGLMKTVQHECFVEKKLSMREYFQSIVQYEDKLSKTIQRIVTLESAKANIFKFKRAKLELERKRLLDLMKETQHQYIKEKELDTRVYNRRMQSYSTRLSEIEEELATREAERALRRDKLRRFLRFVAFVKTLKVVKQKRAKRLVEKGKKKALIEKLRKEKEKARRKELLEKLKQKKAEELRKKATIEKAKREKLERRFLAIAAREERGYRKLAEKKKKERLKQLRLQEKLRLKVLEEKRKKEDREKAKKAKLERRFLAIAAREEKRQKKLARKKGSKK